MRTYRAQFQRQGFGLETPRAILAVNVTVGDTSTDAQRLVGSAKGYYARLRPTGGDAQLPSADEAARELTTTEREQPTSIVDDQWPQFVAGNPDEVRATLERMVDESPADEIMIQNRIADPDGRRHSHTLLAQSFGLTPRRTSAGGAAETYAEAQA
ncbi:hypothetical protein [Blastococcus montanus]|uniref:hypothetical protein n=1 Tax=Blastococcus montanus TaxID=3144973 RepID=UPI003209F2C3